jgi:hypothetical protein
MKGLMEVESTYSRYRTLTHQKLPNYIEDTISKKFTTYLLIDYYTQPASVVHSVSVCLKPIVAGRVNTAE